jgi:hypothetical protein
MLPHSLILALALVLMALSHSLTHAIQMTGVKSTHQKKPSTSSLPHSHTHSHNHSQAESTRRYLQEEEVDLDIAITELTTEARVLLEMTVDPPGE